MKKILSGIFLSSIFVCGAALADLLPNEVNMCAGVTCTPAMQAVQDAFAGSVSFNPLTTSPGLYTGPCFYIMSHMDPTVQHFGGFTLWRDADSVMKFNGSFHFFASKNPYEGMTAQEGHE